MERGAAGPWRLQGLRAPAHARRPSVGPKARRDARERARWRGRFGKRPGGSFRCETASAGPRAPCPCPGHVPARAGNTRPHGHLHALAGERAQQNAGHGKKRGTDPRHDRKGPRTHCPRDGSQTRRPRPITAVMRDVGHWQIRGDRKEGTAAGLGGRLGEVGAGTEGTRFLFRGRGWLTQAVSTDPVGRAPRVGELYGVQTISQ